VRRVIDICVAVVGLNPLVQAVGGGRQPRATSLQALTELEPAIRANARIKRLDGLEESYAQALAGIIDPRVSGRSHLTPPAVLWRLRKRANLAGSPRTTKTLTPRLRQHPQHTPMSAKRPQRPRGLQLLELRAQPTRRPRAMNETQMSYGRRERHAGLISPVMQLGSLDCSEHERIGNPLTLSEAAFPSLLVSGGHGVTPLLSAKEHVDEHDRPSAAESYGDPGIEGREPSVLQAGRVHQHPSGRLNCCLRAIRAEHATNRKRALGKITKRPPGERDRAGSEATYGQPDTAGPRGFA